MKGCVRKLKKSREHGNMINSFRNKFIPLGILVIVVLSMSLLAGCDKKTEQKPIAVTPTDNVTVSVSPTSTPTSTPTATPTPTPHVPKDWKVKPEELPKIDGATALAPFYEAIAAELTGMPVEDARMFVQCNTTDSAFQNLIDGKVDMIFCALPSDEQVAAAAKAGVEFECYTILNGAFVFFVNKDNPIKSLTLEQLQKIYSGRIKNWKYVGGDDVEIIAYQRNEGSGSQTALYRYILPKKDVDSAPIVHYYAGAMKDMVDSVAEYDNGLGSIGYSFYYYINNMYGNENIKMIGVNWVVPNYQTISKGEYPFLNFSQIIIRKGTPKDSNVYKVIDWILQGNGDRIAEELGYVPNHMKND